MTVPLSVCLLACNEEQAVERCLRAVAAIADEVVVVVDAKSADGSEKVAREHADRVEVRPYAGDIDQKRYCVSLASHEWVLVVDPDEVVPPALARELRETIEAAGPEVAGVEIDRLTRHLGRWIRHGDFHPDWTLRAFRRGRARCPASSGWTSRAISSPPCRLPPSPRRAASNACACRTTRWRCCLSRSCARCRGC